MLQLQITHTHIFFSLSLERDRRPPELVQIEELLTLLDAWLMFDGLRYMSFFDVTSNAVKLLSVEVQDDHGDYSEIRDS